MKSRLSRRSLITDFGAAGLGLIVFSACGGSRDDTAAEPTDDAAVPDTEGAAPEASQPATTDAGSPTSTSADATGPLQLQHVSLGFVSAYVLVRGGEAAIVDTGTEGSRDAILDGLDALAATPSMVRHVVLTHNHGDHIGGLAGLEADLSSATLYAGAGDIGSIQSSLALSEVGDGDEVFGMGVIGTPGHTPGSISLFDTDSGILVAGDAINGDGAGGLTGPNPDFSDDMAAALESVGKLAALAPSTAAFGHGGGPVTDDVAAKLRALV